MVAALALAWQRAPAQETRSELWPELDVYVQSSSRLREYFLWTRTRAVETPYREQMFGAHLDYRISQRWSARAGYRYAYSLDDTSYRENRAVGEVTFRTPIGGGVKLLDRTRLDLRWQDDFSARLRNRPRLERSLDVGGGATLLPYVMDELFYDSRYRTVNRNRLSIGIEWQFHPRSSIDVGYNRQADREASVRHVNALGLALSLFL